MNLGRFSVLGVLLLSAGILIAACTSASGPQPQSFTGSFGAEWNGLVRSVRATSPDGVVTTSTLDQSSRFDLSVAGGQVYTFEIVRADGSTLPLVFPRRSGLSTSLRVSSGVGAFDFGQVRLVTPFRSSSFMIGSGGGDNEDVECEDGVDALTGLPCADEDDEFEACEGDGEEDEADEDDGADEDATDDDDVGCEDGVDALTGLPCDDSGDEEEADAECDCGEDTDDVEEECEDGIDALTGLPCDDSGDEGEAECECDDEGDLELDEAGVPDSIPPEGLGSCGDEEEDGVDEEQEGEHEG